MNVTLNFTKFSDALPESGRPVLVIYGMPDEIEDSEKPVCPQHINWIYFESGSVEEQGFGHAFFTDGRDRVSELVHKEMMKGCWVYQTSIADAFPDMQLSVSGDGAAKFIRTEN